jgi:hypothetical protein
VRHRLEVIEIPVTRRLEGRASRHRLGAERRARRHAGSSEPHRCHARSQLGEAEPREADRGRPLQGHASNEIVGRPP